jgi:5'-methylthioadenosine phosphorylase
MAIGHPIRCLKGGTETVQTKLGIIGGSGLYDLPGLVDIRWIETDTPWGKPSDALMHAMLGETPLVFLPRHGRGHRLMPHEVNYRANIAALKAAGVTDVLSVSACGSFREAMPPGTFVLVDQYIDRTLGRARSFFGGGVVAHVSMAEPACNRLSHAVAKHAKALDIPHHMGGTYLAMEGPQFSTKAESHLYRSWGADVIGMTNLPEAYLAREAELCYLTLAMVTDFDSWNEAAGTVDIQQIISTLAGNVAQARALVRALAQDFAPARGPCAHGCNTALDHAIMTGAELRPTEAVAKLHSIAARVL